MFRLQKVGQGVASRRRLAASTCAKQGKPGPCAEQCGTQAASCRVIPHRQKVCGPLARIFVGVRLGARSRNRTGKGLLPADFKSDASTSFAIRAGRCAGARRLAGSPPRTHAVRRAWEPPKTNRALFPGPCRRPAGPAVFGAGNESCTRALSRCSQTLPSLKGLIERLNFNLILRPKQQPLSTDRYRRPRTIPSRAAPHATPHRSRAVEQARHSHHRMPATACRPNWACTYTDGSQTRPDFARQRGSGSSFSERPER